MTKTIEEAAREYAAQVDKNVEELYGIEQPASLTFGECAAEAFRAGAAHVLSLPLSQRLTDEERERVRKMYESELEFAQFYQQKANCCCNTQCKMDYTVARDIAKSRAGLLESIFGKELFGEE